MRAAALGFVLVALGLMGACEKAAERDSVGTGTEEKFLVVTEGSHPVLAAPEPSNPCRSMTGLSFRDVLIVGDVAEILDRGQNDVARYYRVRTETGATGYVTDCPGLRVSGGTGPAATN